MKSIHPFEFESDGKSLTSICKAHYGDLPWLVPDIIPLEGVSMIVGSPKAGKSLLILNIILSALTDNIILKFYPPASTSIKILYLDLESSPRRIKTRAERILGDSTCPHNLVFATRWPRIGEGGLSKLRTALEYGGYNLVIIDTLGCIQSKRKISNVHSYAKDQEEIELFHNLCLDYGTSIVLVHHTRKAKSEDWVDMVSGSHGISGSVDTLLYLYRPKEAPHATLHVAGRDVNEETYRLGFDASTETWEMCGTLVDIMSPLTKARQEVINVLNAHEGVMTPLEIATLVHKSPGAIKSILANLVADGRVLRESYGHYTKRMHD